MIRRPPRSTQSRSSAASDVYKRQLLRRAAPARANMAVLQAVRGHCQVPCGIFDDPAKVAELQQDAATIRKAMIQIEELNGAGDALSFNQATRWVMTKEDHANKVISTASEYMLAQRVKVELFDNKSDYLDALEAHHKLIQSAMKTKQVLDLSAADSLDHAITDIAAMYTK
eukprot:TRINITY_DN15595_c0_g1_i1.p1 TRINITY_DN15595_c0_g1~~TRINITY_DN15595_c0_g1_i1.p1  ORF type:complete len:171 (+),score=70.08 TRINITY_DN15595_c0_g1_i1:100-612(+)